MAVYCTLTHRLGDAYDNFLKTAPTNSYAVMDEQGWHLSADSGEKLDQEAQDRLNNLKSWLAQNMRRVKLPELLIEVDNELSFTRHFLTPAQRQEPSPEDGPLFSLNSVSKPRMLSVRADYVLSSPQLGFAVMPTATFAAASRESLRF
jgi:hypothetical protein